jgi:hypothetical protein
VIRKGGKDSTIRNVIIIIVTRYVRFCVVTNSTSHLWKSLHGDTVFAELDVGYVLKEIYSCNFLQMVGHLSLFRNATNILCIYSIIHVIITQIAVFFLNNNRMYLQSQLHLKTG